MSLPPRHYRSRHSADRDQHLKVEAAVTWDSLDDAEKAALKRMNRGPYPELPRELGTRLAALGLAVLRPEGIGISRSGRKLVIDELLGRAANAAEER